MLIKVKDWSDGCEKIIDYRKEKPTWKRAIAESVEIMIEDHTILSLFIICCFWGFIGYLIFK